MRPDKSKKLESQTQGFQLFQEIHKTVKICFSETFSISCSETFGESFDDGSSVDSIDWKLLKIKKISKKDRAGNAPITFFKANSRYSFFWMDELPDLVIEKEGVIPNPILMGKPITSFIAAQDIYQELNSYISSLNDKEVLDTRTDIQKAESAGFDRRTSFRNIK